MRSNTLGEDESTSPCPSVIFVTLIERKTTDTSEKQNLENYQDMMKMQSRHLRRGFIDSEKFCLYKRRRSAE